MLVGQKLGLKVETDHSGTFADLMCINVGADFIFPPWCALHYLLFTLHFVDIAKMHNILKCVKMIICALQKARQPGPFTDNTVMGNTDSLSEQLCRFEA